MNLPVCVRCSLGVRGHHLPMLTLLQPLQISNLWIVPLTALKSLLIVCNGLVGLVAPLFVLIVVALCLWCGMLTTDVLSIDLLSVVGVGTVFIGSEFLMELEGFLGRHDWAGLYDRDR